MVLFQKFFLRRRLISLVILITYGCGGPLNLPPVSVTPAQSYRLQKEAGGIAVAVDPYVEEDRVKEYFGANLIKDKLLPALFVIENRQGKDGVMVQSSQIMVVLQDKAAQPGAEQPGVTVPTAGQNLMAVIGPLAAAGAVVPVAGLAAIALLPFLAVAGSREEKAKQVNDNLTKKALVDRTLYPGETASGFVYFPLSQPDQASKVAGFAVRVKNLKTDQVVEVVLPGK